MPLTIFFELKMLMSLHFERFSTISPVIEVALIRHSVLQVLAACSDYDIYTVAAA